ncbi:HAMP domain-containing histidine kinase [Mesobaculum littorinae]|uniref:histidine kinase n=1 Tax=Mesobaculum littorinae TaxID=2486419 RepID=A0A438AL70_9RHOB|nr:HAMP domain-containing sensor histidine kinase [Mesobaculum littorinae]RVV99327.1 HAMP domain-containing histidine kinase [Mesobaculum littorinae]
MKIYEFLARRNWPRSYSGKIMLVSFLGVHIPMLGAVTYVLMNDGTPFKEQIGVLAAMLVATLLGTAGTMFVMHALLAPMQAATRAADGYLRDRRTPRLPVRYTDEAGVLMASVQEAITRLDTALATTEMQRAQLETDHRAKFKMLAGMRHDFRTPLTHILGFAELMKAETLGPLGGEAYRKYAATIGRSGQELLQTLQSVLDLSDAETRHQISEDSETIDLVDYAQRAISLEHLNAERRGVQVELAGPKVLTAHTVPGVARNLLSALVEAGVARTPQGGSVILGLAQGGAGPEFWATSLGGTLALEDVPPEMEGFFDDLQSGTGATSGTAETSTPMTLRLSLIDTLARAIGARLTMDQAPGQGFRLRVELAPASATPASDTCGRATAGIAAE